MEVRETSPSEAAHNARSASPSPSVEPHERSISITVTLAGATHTISLPASAILDDLTLECEELWGSEYDWSSHKFIAPPPAGLLKGGERGDYPLAALDGKKLRLMASKLSEVDALHAAEQRTRRMAEVRARQRAEARRHQAHHRHDHKRAHDDSTYTFLQLRPLAGLPNPERSLDFLARLRDDPGIRAAMRAHRFTVGLLTEMDPTAYTEVSHEGTTRTLGLNRNKGEVIELRLRTDAYDGYRDYRTIRRTLCHELAHNVHSPHDRNFWDLCHQIEREVDRADYTAHGRTLDGGPMYEPSGAEEEEEDALDHGGWTGGEFVLGGSSAAAGASANSSGSGGLSRREILAKAAEERIRRMAQEKRDPAEGEGARK